MRINFKKTLFYIALMASLTERLKATYIYEELYEDNSTRPLRTSHGSSLPHENVSRDLYEFDNLENLRKHMNNTVIPLEQNLNEIKESLKNINMITSEFINRKQKVGIVQKIP